MAKLVLYGIDISPPVRACLMTLKALDLCFEYKIVNMFEQEHLSEEFKKRNPQHTVPLLDDNGAYIWDSHAICAYLVSKYGKEDHPLYPKDLVKRAIVDQRMYFDASVLFMGLRSITAPLFRKNITVVMKEKTENIKEGYSFVESFLGSNPYITGDTLTIADFCCAATIASLCGIVNIEISRFPKTFAWLHRLAELPYYKEANEKGAADHIKLLRSRLTEIIV